MTVGFVADALLHVGDTGVDRVLMLLLLFGALASIILVGLGILALFRRRSRAYVLVVFALSTFAAKAFVGGLATFGGDPVAGHHTIEHGLDLVAATLLLAAVVSARRDPRRAAGAEGS